MKRLIIASVLILGGVLNAAADTYVFKDIQKPNGQPTENIGGPGRTRTSNQTVMSGRL
jgi:hypothetical protein